MAPLATDAGHSRRLLTPAATAALGRRVILLSATCLLLPSAGASVHWIKSSSI